MIMKSVNSLSKKLIAAIVAGAILLTLPMAGCNNPFDSGKDNEGSKSSDSSGSSKKTSGASEENLNGKTVMKTAHYSIPFNVFEYFYNAHYQEFANTYGSVIDASKPLDEQYYDSEHKTSWKEYFIETAKDNFIQIMLFAESALKDGMTLTDEDKKTLDQAFAQLEEMAAQNGQTADEYFKSMYGDNITREDVRKIQEMSTLGMKYREKVQKGCKFTDEEYEAEFQKDKTANEIADYYTYTFGFAKPDDDGTSMIVDEKAKKEMKEHAEALANSKNAKEFNDYLTKFLQKNPSMVPISADDEKAQSSLTEAEFTSALNSYVESCAHLKEAYSDSSDLKKWIFDESRKTGDTKVQETETGYDVVLIEKPIYRDETSTRNVRHILITADSLVSAGEATDTASVKDEQVKAYAQKIYDEWTAKDTTEEHFAELANTYSTDPGSNTNGGLYENVTQGTMVPSFNDWMFDKARKQGDSGIVKTDYGYHIMYYVGTGLKVWQVSIHSTLVSEKVKAAFEEMKKTIPIEYDRDLMNKVNITIKEEASEEESSAANLAN